MKTNNKQLEYNFYYYTNEAEFKINLKTWLSYGLIICACLIIMSVETLFQKRLYVQLSISTILFIVILLMIRRFNK